MTFNPRITNPEEYGYAQDEQETVQDSNPTAEEITKRFFSLTPPKPEFDRAKAERLQKMSRLNSLGRGVNVLGDVLSLGLGANVRRRQPDTVAPGIFSTFEGMMDKYKGEKDAYRFQEYQKKLNDLQLGLGRRDKADAEAYRDKAHEDAMKAAAAKNALDWGKFEATYNQREKDIALKAQKQGQDAAHDEATLRLGYARLENDLNKYFDKQNKFMQIQVDGQLINLQEGEFRGLLKEAVKSKAFTKDDLKAMMEGFQNNPLEATKNIVQRYAEWKAGKQNLTSQQPAIDNLVNAGSFNQVVGNALSPMNGTGPLMSHGNNPVNAPTQKFDPSKYESNE